MPAQPRLRPYLALAAMLTVPAKAALATSPVEIARAQEHAVGSWSAPDAQAPASPLAIASSLGVATGSPTAMREAEIQIQLRHPEGAQRGALAFDRQYQ